MDWEKLFNKEVPPPFVPDVSTEDDVSKIDPEFLAEAPRETPAENSVLMRTLADETNFDNFTFVNDNNLSRLGSELGNGSQLQAINSPKGDKDMKRLQTEFKHNK